MLVSADLDEILSLSDRIGVMYKGRIIKARVGTDGKISYKGKTYTSPSIAGAYARRKKTLNGWKSWKYKNKEGDWVYLDEIRKKKAKSKKKSLRRKPRSWNVEQGVNLQMK